MGRSMNDESGLGQRWSAYKTLASLYPFSSFHNKPSEHHINHKSFTANIIKSIPLIAVFVMPPLAMQNTSLNQEIACHPCSQCFTIHPPLQCQFCFAKKRAEIQTNAASPRRLEIKGQTWRVPVPCVELLAKSRSSREKEWAIPPWSQVQKPTSLLDQTMSRTPSFQIEWDSQTNCILCCVIVCCCEDFDVDAYEAKQTTSLDARMITKEDMSKVRLKDVAWSSQGKRWHIRENAG